MLKWEWETITDTSKDRLLFWNYVNFTAFHLLLFFILFLKVFYLRLAFILLYEKTCCSKSPWNNWWFAICCHFIQLLQLSVVFFEHVVTGMCWIKNDGKCECDKVNSTRLTSHCHHRLRRLSNQPIVTRHMLQLHRALKEKRNGTSTKQCRDQVCKMSLLFTSATSKTLSLTDDVCLSLSSLCRGHPVATHSDVGRKEWRL